MEKVTFNIDGIEYHSTPLDGVEGIPVIAEIMSLASEPVIVMLKLQLSSGGTTDLQTVFADLDTSALAKSTREALHRLGERPEILMRLFSRTVRDGQPLSNPAAFKMAYQGRWMEMLKAIVEIVKLNNFLPF